MCIVWFNFQAFENLILFHKFWCIPNLYFPRTKSYVTTQLRDKFASYMLQVHYVTHKTNLASQILWKLPLVFKIEAMWKIHWISMLSPTNFDKIQVTWVQTWPAPTPFYVVIKETLEGFAHCPYFHYSYFFTN